MTFGLMEYVSLQIAGYDQKRASFTFSLLCLHRTRNIVPPINLGTRLAAFNGSLHLGTITLAKHIPEKLFCHTEFPVVRLSVPLDNCLLPRPDTLEHREEPFSVTE